MIMPACPNLEELAQIGIAGGAESCPPGFATHIERCPGCRDVLALCVRDGFDSLIPETIGLPASDALPHIEGFTIERELGRGAMGVVYLAHRQAPQPPVALKLLPGGRHAGTRQRRQWLREAEAAAMVRHPNVVTLYDVAEADDWFFLELEYLAGGTLADRLSEPLAPRHAARLTETIARAVHHIHQCGQLHLDLKPSNILLDGKPDSGWDTVIPKVSDFGIARSAQPGATDTGWLGAGGTPSYMAPEQITQPRNAMSPAADIHGLGGILYHLLTGRPPYQGATVLETIDLVQRQEAVPPRRLNPRIPRDLETICLKCLEKEPGRRYPTAELLADDLSRWVAGLPITARRVSLVEKGWRSCRHRPALTALAAALILAVSVNIFAFSLLWKRSAANFTVSNEMLDDLLEPCALGQDGLPMALTVDRLETLRRAGQDRGLIALVVDRLPTVHIPRAPDREREDAVEIEPHGAVIEEDREMPCTAVRELADPAPIVPALGIFGRGVGIHTLAL